MYISSKLINQEEEEILKVDKGHFLKVVKDQIYSANIDDALNDRIQRNVRAHDKTVLKD